MLKSLFIFIQSSSSDTNKAVKILRVVPCRKLCPTHGTWLVVSKCICFLFSPVYITVPDSNSGYGKIHPLGRVNNIPTMQFFTGISRNTQSTHMLSMTECVWEFQNNALWDTLQHALLVGIGGWLLLIWRVWEANSTCFMKLLLPDTYYL